jgi:Fe-S cluster biogenesis protein NfuA
MASMQNGAGFEQRIERIDALVAQFEASADPVVRDGARELVRAIMDMHGAGLEQLLTILADAAGGQRLIEEAAGDSLVGSLLLLYGLHPVPFSARVNAALEKTRPYLRSHGGDVELLGTDDSGNVRLRLEGSCHGCPSSSVTLKLAIEQAIRENAPDTGEIMVESDVAPVPVASEPALISIRP